RIDVPLIPPGVGRNPLTNPLRKPAHPLGTNPSYESSVGLRKLCTLEDSVVNRDLGDVGGIIRAPSEAVHDRREREPFLPLSRGDVVGEAINHLLVPGEFFHGLL